MVHHSSPNKEMVTSAASMGCRETVDEIHASYDAPIVRSRHTHEQRQFCILHQTPLAWYRMNDFIEYWLHLSFEQRRGSCKLTRRISTCLMQLIAEPQSSRSQCFDLWPLIVEVFRRQCVWYDAQFQLDPIFKEPMTDKHLGI